MTLGTPMKNRIKQSSTNVNEPDDNTSQAESSDMLTQDERLVMNKEQLETMRRAQEEADKERELLREKLSEQEKLYEEQKRKEEEKARKRMENLEKIMMLEIDGDGIALDDGDDDDDVEDEADEFFDDSDDMEEVVYEDD